MHGNIVERSPGWDLNLKLHQDDIDGIQELYGPNPNAVQQPTAEIFSPQARIPPCFVFKILLHVKYQSDAIYMMFRHHARSRTTGRSARPWTRSSPRRTGRLTCSAGLSTGG